MGAANARHGGTVLVTGASTGIGQATALHLGSLGFQALAGVRREEDAERLRERGISTVLLDITDADSVAAVAEQIGDAPLAGLVNNAGISVAGPLEFLPLDHIRHQLEVNVVGQLAVTQALLPALRRGRGRIVNVSSLGGRLAVPLLGAYNASKFALEAVSDTLRRELHGQGVDVIVIEPGGVKTEIWRKSGEAGDELIEQMPPEAERLYGRIISVLRAEADRIDTETGMPAHGVAEVIGRALTARRPRTRYLVGTDAKLRGTVNRLLPDRVMDRLVARELG